MSLQRRVWMGLAMAVACAAAQAEGYYGEYPSAVYVKAGSEGLDDGHAVGLSAFRPNLVANHTFDAGTNGWVFSTTGLQYQLLTSAETGERYLRLNKTGTNTVHASYQAALPNGTYRKSYINGAALIDGEAGKEGLVSLIIESSKIRTPVEKKLRFKYAGDGWNVVRFNVDQDLTGHLNVKLTLRFYPRFSGYQRLDKVFLDIIPATEVNLPSGVKATTTGSRNLCFASGELTKYDDAMPRAAVEGCAAPGVITPQSVVESYDVYMPDRQTVNCRTNRANEFHTRYLNNFLEELVELADATERNPQAAGVQCAANTLAYWAERQAMTEISPHGSPQQSKYDRIWVYAGIGATYLKNPHIRARAIALGKDAAILAWLHTIGQQISQEVEADRNVGGQNNISYWRGFSILPTALLTQDRALLANSRRVFLDGIDEIIDDVEAAEDDKGFLRPELARLTRSLGYHGFAAKPLYAMALYSQAYGCDFAGYHVESKKQLERLTRKTVQGFYEPKVFSAAIKLYLGKSNVKVLVDDYRELMYLAHLLDPAMSAHIASFVLLHTGETVSRTYGSTDGDDRFGGSYARLKDALPLLRPLEPMALAADCPN